MDILFAGELNADLIMTGFEKIPSLGIETIGKNYQFCMGSSTAICACVASSLGLKTGFFGKLGLDLFGQLIINSLHKYGIDTSLIQTSKEWLTGLTVSISLKQDRALATVFGDTIDCFDATEVPLEKSNSRHLHVSSYFFQPKVRIKLPQLYKKAKALGMTTSLDAGWDEKERWQEGLSEILPVTDFFFPNENEACAIANTGSTEEAARIIADMGCNVIVKNGDKGCILCEKGSSSPIVISSFPVPKVIDTTGAGDSFNGGFLYAFLHHLPLEECAVYGNAAGAISVTRIGGATQCPTLEEVENLISTGLIQNY